MESGGSGLRVFNLISTNISAYCVMDEQGSSGASETRLPNRHFSFSLLAFNPISKQFISIDRRNKGGLEGVSCPAFNYFLIIVLQNHADELQELVLETIFEKFISRKALNLI